MRNTDTADASRASPESKDSREAMRVAWLPAHPSERSISMARYWSALHDENLASSSPIDIQCPLGEPADVRKPASRWNRAWHRYVAYPRLVAHAVRSPLVHILDHSSSHLISRVPVGAKTIVTVHDLIPLYAEADLTAAQRSRFHRIVQHLRSADLLIAVSEYTREKIESLLDISPARIVVNYPGVDAAAFRRIGTLPSVLQEVSDMRLVLSIGSADSRKNLALLPEVFERLGKDGSDLCLVRVGAPLPGDLRERLLQTLGTRGLLELGLVADKELPAIYQSVSALVFPSFEEGFGLPLLEAMAAGCPVTSSNAASLPEAGGDAALFFTPDSAQQAAHALRQIFEQPQLVADLRERGSAHADRFSWKRHFERVVEAYGQVLQEKA